MLHNSKVQFRVILLPYISSALANIIDAYQVTAFCVFIPVNSSLYLEQLSGRHHHYNHHCYNYLLHASLHIYESIRTPATCKLRSTPNHFAIYSSSLEESASLVSRSKAQSILVCLAPKSQLSTLQRLLLRYHLNIHPLLQGGIASILLKESLCIAQLMAGIVGRNGNTMDTYFKLFNSILVVYVL